MSAPGPKNRWFRFNTRGKIVIAAFSLVLAALVVWFGCELYSIHVRKAFLAKVIAEGGHWQDHEAFKFDSRISSFREFFGDTSVAIITFPDEANQSEYDEAAELFPEAVFNHAPRDGGFF